MPPEIRDRSPSASLAAALTAARAAGRLGRLGSSVLSFPVLGSTNDVALSIASAGGREGTIVVADAQTAGRGRRGRQWFSPPATGLYVSTILAPAAVPRDPDRATAVLTLAAGVALHEAIESTTGLRPELKWPNDLVIDGRKVAGILAEGVSLPSRGLARVVLGYGINVARHVPPPDLAGRITSLEAAIGHAVDRAALCAETVAALGRRYDDLLNARFDAILDAWRARAPRHAGAPIAWETPSGRRSGVTRGIDDRGALLVTADHGLERIVAGEVTWL